MPKYLKPYIDSSVWLGWKNREIVKGVDRYAIFQTIWEAAQRGEFKLYTSAMTFAEVYKLRHQTVIQPQQTVEDLLADFEEPFVQVIEIDREVGRKANEFCRQFAANKLYPNDSLHLASALAVPCDYLLAYDRPFSSVTISGILIDVPTVVSPPFHVAQQSLEGFSPLEDILLAKPNQKT